MVEEFHKEIVELKNKVLEMADFALNMLEDGVNALVNQDKELALSTVDRKQKIREYDSYIEENTLPLIALYQPMAKDLRRIGTILKIITYITRLGRYGKDIAQVAEILADKYTYPMNEYITIQHMWDHVKSMIKDSIKAFDNADITKLTNFEERDDEVDKMRWNIFRESLTFMMEDPKNITPSAHLIMVARYLERCGDHACKIAEKVHYMVTGEHIEIS
jgi:phosphate transport system protein